MPSPMISDLQWPSLAKISQFDTALDAWKKTTYKIHRLRPSQLGICTILRLRTTYLVEN